VVKFDGLPAMVRSVTPNSLVVIVPKGIHAGRRSLSVTVVGGGTGNIPPVLVTEISVSTIAGVPQVPGTTSNAVNLPALSEKFNQPYGLTLDHSGSFIYVADAGNNTIKIINLSNGTAYEQEGECCVILGTDPGLIYPTGVLFSRDGNQFFIVDNAQSCIRVQPVDDLLDLFNYAGTAGSPGYFNSTLASAEFRFPNGIAEDANGVLYVTDQGNSVIRSISGGTVSLFTGNPTSPGFANGTGGAAQFNHPAGIAIDNQGNLYVADSYNNRIRKITPQGVVSTYAGTGAPGFADGDPGSATFNGPNGIAVDNSGNVYVADYNNNAIRLITINGSVITLTGTGTPGFNDGLPDVAQFNGPTGVAVDAKGVIYVADRNNHCIRKLVWVTAQ
jgi:serine/threonine-protein kinase